jgi:hypothetical protein
MATTRASLSQRREGRVLEQGARHEERALTRAAWIERESVGRSLGVEAVDQLGAPKALAQERADHGELVVS